jgi:hypothetical protein
MRDRSNEKWVRNDTPVYILCGSDELPGDGCLGLVEASPDAERGIYGLLWGAGDCGQANLGWSQSWAVVKVLSFMERVSGDSRWVEFQEGEVVVNGDRPGALRALIELGADPANFAFEFQSAENLAVASVGKYGVAHAPNNGIARSGPFGWAQSGCDGIAKAGFFGIARVEAYGLAVADEVGHAVAGDYGVAVSDGKRFGYATAGTGGVAVGRGRFKVVAAGEFGVAVATSGSSAIAGDSGVAICYSERASVGTSGIAIGQTVNGNLGSLLVATSCHPETGERSYATGIVGNDGIEPLVYYRCIGGALQRADTVEPNPSSGLSWPAR